MCNFSYIVVVPIYNEESNIDHLLNSILSDFIYTHDKCMKIVFIDDGSTDESNQKLTKYLNSFSKFLLVNHNSNIGYGGALKTAINRYKNDCNLFHNQWPKTFRYENLRIKRFLCEKNQQHDTHVDVSNADNAKRFLALVCYLNDDFDEGETEFPQFNFKTKVETGSLALFPVSWTYLHRGRPPKNGHAKYMLGTFLQYDRKRSMDILGYKTMGVKEV